MSQLSLAMSDIEANANIDDDDSILRLVQAKRRNMVLSLSSGYELPADPKDRVLLQHVLADMANTAMSRKKLGAAKEQSNLDREAQVLIATLNSQLQGRSPFAVPTDAQGNVLEGQLADRPIPKLQLSEERQFPDSAKERGLAIERYDEFAARMTPIMDEKQRQAARDAGLADE